MIVRNYLADVERNSLVKAGDDFAAELGKLEAKYIAKFRPDVQDIVRTHLQDCTSLYSPYTDEHLEKKLKELRRNAK